MPWYLLMNNMYSANPIYLKMLISQDNSREFQTYMLNLDIESRFQDS